MAGPPFGGRVAGGMRGAPAHFLVAYAALVLVVGTSHWGVIAVSLSLSRSLSLSLALFLFSLSCRGVLAIALARSLARSLALSLSRSLARARALSLSDHLSLLFPRSLYRESWRHYRHACAQARVSRRRARACISARVVRCRGAGGRASVKRAAFTRTGLAGGEPVATERSFLVLTAPEA